MIYSAAHNVIVYKHDNPAQVAATIPDARVVGSSYVAIPATLFSLQLARLLGLPVPPLLDIVSYDWPMQPGRAPYAHQKYMASFAALHPKHFNLSEMGTGKTLSALWAADYLMHEGVVQKCLIVSPLSTLKRVWEDEIFRNFLGKRSSVVLHGDREKRLQGLRKNRDFYIINHDGLGIGSRRGNRGIEIGPVGAAFRDRGDVDLVVVDEASAYKDGATQRTRILRQVIEHKPYVWLMSGTPTPNAPTDAWSLARLIGNLQGESLRSFTGRTMAQVSTFKWVPRSNSAEIVRKALSPAVRFSREECIDLPECVVETRDVPMSPTQETAYKALKKDLQVVIGRGTITAINEAVLRLKLLQISAGAVYGPDREVHRTDAEPRTKILKEVIDEAGAKVLVFASFTSVVRLVASELRKEYGENAVAMVYGETSQNARSEIFRKFERESDLRIIVADPGTMSHGLTLVAANTIVWYSPVDRAEVYQQACARINRPGQTRKMLIVQLSGTAVEREIFRRLEAKESLQGALLKIVAEDR